MLATVACGLSFFPLPAASAHAVLVPPAASGACPGAATNSTFSGRLSVEGGPLSATAAADVGIDYSYWIQSETTYFPSNGTTLVACTLETGSTTTGSNGAFGFSIAPPGLNCWEDPPYGEACATYSGPYAPVSVNVSSATPAGYGLSVAASGSTYDLDWVADLARVSLAPSASPLVISTEAPTEVLATPLAANDSRSPLVANYSWDLNGSGWSFTATPGDQGVATVLATVGALAGNLSVAANETVGADAFSTPALDVPLVAVSTALTSAAIGATVADVGQPVPLELVVSGAPGYSYVASVALGSGGGPSAVPCRSVSSAGPVAAFNCSTAVSFPTPGPARVAVNVSNGFSSSTWTSASVTVDPATGIAVDPDAPVGYAGVPIAVNLSASPGSGTPPYRSACFEGTGATGAGCATSPGPNWTFRPTYPATGNFTAVASVLDSAGANTTRTVGVRVVAALAVGPVAPDVANVTVGVPVKLPSSVAGGDLPAEVWWNVSGGAAPLAAYAVDADGSIAVTFTPSAIGPANVTVSVRDALGTERSANRTIAVVIGDAAGIAAASPPPSTGVVVGTVVPLAWQALDVVGRPVTDFAAAGTLSVASGSGARALAWANVSGAGPLSAAPEASFVVPASAWVDGALNVNFTPVSSGTLTVTLAGPGVLADAPTFGVTGMPDLLHLALFDPTVALAGDHANRTFWHVADRFGNPVPGADLVIQYTSGGAALDLPAAVASLPNGGTGVWLNYSLAGPGDSVRVLDLAGTVLLGPFTWSGPHLPPAAELLESVLAIAGSVGAAGALVSARARRRPPDRAAGDDDAAARRLALGRAAIVEILGAAGPVPAETIEDLWEPPPAPPDLLEWIASLVADGTIVGRPTARGRVAYALAPEPVGARRVVVDPTAVDRAIARREAAVRAEDEPDAR